AEIPARGEAAQAVAYGRDARLTGRFRDALDLGVQLVCEAFDARGRRGEIRRENRAHAARLERSHERREIAAIGKIAMHQHHGDAARGDGFRIGTQAPALPRSETEIV